MSILAAACAATHAWGAELFHFDIPAGNAEETLRVVTSVAQYPLLYLVDEVRGVRTNPIVGDFGPEEAVRRMLEGTGLAFFPADLVVRPIETPAAGPPSAARSPSGSAVATRGLPSLASTFANKQPEALQEVVVTGTLIRGVFDIVSPLTFVKNRQLRAGYGGVRDALQSLPITFGGGPSEYVDPGGNFNRGASLNLRGLGPGATLVLINGRRQPFGGFDAEFVDVSSIPWSAVERVEVLPDGASASYGSDAVAGVVNVIMRDDFVGAETQARFGFAAGGGDETIAGQLFGAKWDSGKFLFAYQFSDRTALGAGDRYYTASADKTSLGGRNFSSVRSNPGNIFDLAQRTAFGIPEGQDGTALTVDQLLPGSLHFKNQFENFDLVPDRRMHSGYFSTSQNLGQRLEFFGEARVSQSEINQRFVPTEQLLVVPRSNAFFIDPFGGSSPAVLVGYDFSDDFGYPVALGLTRNYIGTVGFRSDFGDTWKANTSVSYGVERMRWSVRNQVDPLQIQLWLADSNRATAFNPFGDGSHTNPETLEKIRFTQEEQAVSDVFSFNVIADGEVLALPSGSAKLAVGVDYREEGLDHGVRARSQFGRHVASAFAELAMPIVGNADDPFDVPRLQLSLAGRGERFSDFGSTFNPKIGLQWVPARSVKVRGSWSTSFKAPNLVDLYDTSANRSGMLSLRDPFSATGRSIVLIQQGANRDLHEETASTWTAGVDFAPMKLPGLTMSLTYYSIKYDDRVFTPGQPLSPETVLADPSWAQIVTRNPSASQIVAICTSPTFGGSSQQCLNAGPTVIVDARPKNLSSTLVEGMDLDLQQSLDTAHGAFTLGMQGSYMWRFEQRLTSASSQVEILNTVDNPISLRLRGSVQWDQYGPDLPGFGIELAADHVGAYDDRLSPALRRIDPWTQLNVNLTYRLAGASGSDGVEFMLSGLNVFDAAPPFVDRDSGYDPANAEPIGRIVSFYVRKNW